MDSDPPLLLWLWADALCILKLSHLWLIIAIAFHARQGLVNT